MVSKAPPIEQKIKVREGRKDLPIFINSELDDYGLDVYSFRIYARIARRAGHGGEHYESIKNMAETCLMSDSKVKRSLKILLEFNLIEKDENSGQKTGKPAIYRTTDKSEWKPKPELGEFKNRRGEHQEKKEEESDKTQVITDPPQEENPGHNRPTPQVITDPPTQVITDPQSKSLRSKSQEEKNNPPTPLARGTNEKQEKTGDRIDGNKPQDSSTFQEKFPSLLVVKKTSASELNVLALFDEIEQSKKLTDDELNWVYLAVYKFAKPSNFVDHRKITGQNLKKIKSWVKEYGDRGAIEMFYEALTVIREQKDPWWRITEKFQLQNLLSNGKVESLADKHQTLMATEPDYRDRVNGDAPSLDVVRASRGEHGTDKQKAYEQEYDRRERQNNSDRAEYMQHLQNIRF